MAINHLSPPTGQMADNVIGFARALRGGRDFRSGRAPSSMP